MPHQVFISYSSRDKAAADTVCAGLEARGLTCWIAPRDQSAGKSYGQQITEAINSARVLVLLFSDHVNNSDAVQNEIDLATNAHLVIIPLRLANVAFNPELRFYLGRVHWLDAFDRPVEAYLDALAASVQRALAGRPETSRAADEVAAPPPPPASPPPPRPPPPPPAPGAAQAAAPTGFTTTTLPKPVTPGLKSIPTMVWVIIGAVLLIGVSKLFTSPSATPGRMTTAPAAMGGETPGTVDLPPAGPANPQAVVYYETMVTKDGPPAVLEGATIVTTQDLAARLQNRAAGGEAFTLVDARGCTDEPTIPGAICLAPNTLEELQRRAPTNTPLIVFCHDGGCPYSFQMASAALTAGYGAVGWYRGGINAWSAAGMPRATFSSAASTK